MATPNQNTTPVINVALSGINAIDALIMGTRWDTTSLSYSFADKNSVWSTDPLTGYGAKTSYSEPWDILYKGLNDTEKQAAQSALTAWSNIANISFNQVTESSGSVGEIRFAWSSAGGFDGGQAHVADFPSNDPIAGDIWLNDYQYVTWDGFDPGKYGYLALLHELGHALGLKHTFQATGSSSETLPADQDSYANSIMSYSAYPNEPYSSVSYNPTTPMLDDIAAIQYLYGANTSYNSGDDIYTFKPYGDYFQTIWDGGGNDTILWQGDRFESSTTIDLRAGHWSKLGNPLIFYKENGSVLTSSVYTVAIANNVTIENATGSTGNDTLIGNDANNVLTTGGGNDLVYGYGGDDTLVGAMDYSKYSKDSLYGGAGNDVYVLREDGLTKVIENADEGFDQIQSYSDVYLRPYQNIEEVILLGWGSINVYGNSQNNWIKGNEGNNTLAGLGGNDVFMFDSTSNNGVDTILDISPGDKIEILGAQLSGAVTHGDGQLLGKNEVQCLVQPGKYAVLYIGADNNLGADIAIRLPNFFSLDNIQLSGTDYISFVGEQPNHDPIGSISVSPGFVNGFQYFDVTSEFYDLDGVGAISYKWFADDVEIQGETSDYLRYSTSLIDKKITAQLSYVDQQGYAQQLLSEASKPVSGMIDVNILGKEIQGAANINTVNFFSYYPINLDLTKGTVTSKHQHTTLSEIQNVYATRKSDKVNGNSADNLIDGVGGKDTLLGGAGNDTIQGAGTLSGGVGDDVLIASFGYTFQDFSKLNGNEGNDTLEGLDYRGVLSGGSGNDLYYVETFTDKINLKPSIISNAPKSQILEKPSQGSDTVISRIDFALPDNVESLVLSGATSRYSGIGINTNGSGNTIANTIIGNWGNNILDGKLGSDTLTGGEGYDIFAFDTKLSKTNVDTVTDFFSPADIIALNTKVFASLKTGFDFAKDFITSDHLAEQDSSDHLIYDTSTGDLYYDADGSGKVAAIKFLTLLDAPTLEAGNFKIYSNDADLLNLTY